MTMFHHCASSGRWQTLPRPLRIVGHVGGGLVIIATVALVFGYAAMLLWNAVLPDITALPPISFWQAVGLLLLARLFTGRFSHGHAGVHARARQRRDEAWRQWWADEGEAAFEVYRHRQDAEAQNRPADGR